MALEEIMNWNFFGILGLLRTIRQKHMQFFKELKFLCTRCIHQLNIVGDSKNIIHYFVSGSVPKDDGLKALIECTRIILSSCSVKYFHILWENNKATNEMANRAIGKAPGSLWINGAESLSPLPND
jgi:hypothetical protein